MFLQGVWRDLKFFGATNQLMSVNKVAFGCQENSISFDQIQWKLEKATWFEQQQQVANTRRPNVNVAPKYEYVT